MKIESGLSGYRYQSRVYTINREADEAGVAEEPGRSRTAEKAFSSTLLSPSLASALWVIEGGKQVADTADAARHCPAEEASTGPNGSVLDLYLEFADAGPDELH